VTRDVPVRPLLAPWYRLLEDGDRVLLEHGQSVVVLEGGAVRTLMPALLPLLDGTRSLAELVAELGVAVRPAVEHAIESLTAAGLLVEGPSEPPGGPAAAGMLASAFALSPAGAAERLRTARVGIAGAAPAAVQIGRLLRAAGVGELQRLELERPAPVDFAVVAPDAGDVDELDAWNRRALDEDLRWLPVRRHDGRHAAVGPLIVPRESCCYSCVQLRRAANLAYGDDLLRLERVPVAAPSDPVLDALVAAFTAWLVLRFAVGGDSTLPGVLFAVGDSATTAVTEHTVLRVPRCPACSPAERLAAPLPWHPAEAA
jgi:bacteriocin biosynthesis cyclodehydratase domain-containing protein